MFNVLEAAIWPTSTRIGTVIVKYYNLVLCCDICLYKDQHLWIRMPEMWITKEKKIRFVYWQNEQESKEFQAYVLKKVFDMLDLSVDKAVSFRQVFFRHRKELTNKKTKLTLNEKTPEV